MSNNSRSHTTHLTGYVVAFTAVTVLSLCVMGMTVLLRCSSTEQAVGQAVGRLGRSVSSRVSADLERTAQSFLGRQAEHVAAAMASELRRRPHLSLETMAECYVCGFTADEQGDASDCPFVLDPVSGTVYMDGSGYHLATALDGEAAGLLGLDLIALSQGCEPVVVTYATAGQDDDSEQHYLALAPIPVATGDGRRLLAGLTMPVHEALQESRRIQVATDVMALQVSAILASASADVRRGMTSSLVVIVITTAFLLALSGWIAVHNGRLLTRSEQWHRSLIENAVVGMFVYRDGEFSLVNRRLAAMLGCEPEDLVGSRLLDRVHPAYRELVAQRMRMRASGQDVPECYELQVLTVQGEARWASLWVRSLGDGPDQEVLVIAVDITERKIAEHQLLLSEQKFRILTEQARHPVWVVQEGEIVYCNSALAMYTGMDKPKDAHGLSLHRLTHPDDRPQVEAIMQRLTAGDSEAERIVVRFVPLGDQVRWHDVQFARIEYEGRPAVLADSQDITEIKMLMEQLNGERLRDSLTGLFNRRHFKERFLAPRLASERRHSDLTLLMLDVDGFKLVNDAFGHAMGDRVLRAVADVLRGQLRDCDIAIRFGGDEFLVLMPSVPPAAAETIAGRLGDELVAHLQGLVDQEALPEELSNLVWLSGGAATCGSQGEDTIEAALRVADERMYRHKRQNKWRRRGDYPGAIGRNRRIG